MIAYRYFKRKKRIHDLWNFRVSREQVGVWDCGEQNGPSMAEVGGINQKKSCIIGGVGGEDRKRVMQQLCQVFSDQQLKVFQNVIQDKGAGYGECIMLPWIVDAKSQLFKAQSSPMCPLFLTCQFWRWADLVDTKELRRLTHVCAGRTRTITSPPEMPYHNHKNTLEPVLECCNPYHWSRQSPEAAVPVAMSRVHDQEESLLALLPDRPDWSDQVSEKRENYDSCQPSSSSNSSTETGISRVFGGQPSAGSTLASFTDDYVHPSPGNCYVNPSSSKQIRKHHWCTLICWEENVRIGGKVLFRVVDSIFNVLYGIPRSLQGRGNLSLETLENKDRSAKTERLRKSIGLGFTMILDESDRQVSIYNRTNLPLFISSTYLDDVQDGNCGLRPVKVKPGYSIKAFDLDVVKLPVANRVAENVVPISTNYSSIFVSFGKGWGTGYKRQTVLECNCWIEICLDNLTQTTQTR